MKIVKAGCLFFILILSLSVSHGQDINFSQFYEVPLLRNPSLAGIYTGDVRITSAYKSQWANVTTPYSTMALGSEVKFSLSENSDDYVVFGLQLTHDVAGDSKFGKTQILPVLSYQKLINEEKNIYLSAAIMGGFAQQRFDATGLTFDDQFVNDSYSAANPTKQTFNKSSVSYWDAATGLSLSGMMGADSRFYLGLGVFHFLKPKVAFLQAKDVSLNMKMVFNGGLTTRISEFDKLTLYVDAFTQGGSRQGQGGALITHNFGDYDEDENIAITGGAIYRLSDAIIPVVKFDVYQLGIGVSYDINISKLKTASLYRGGLELTLSYRGFLSINGTSKGRTSCPKF
jgi:type IX secretion system PorP/SprF family membrane protein